ncbi:MAG: zinc ribbon domain-containing protein [Kofleriaceae bacterium]
MVLTSPYVSPAVQSRRARAAEESAARSVGIDVNVSNVTIASHLDGDDVRITRLERDANQRARDERRTRRDRRLRRDLDRSRRAMNRAEYQLSKRQQKLERRRSERGLPPRNAIPMGPRVRSVDGRSVQRYRDDRMSAGYQRIKATLARDQDRARRERRHRARSLAHAAIASHGWRIAVEVCSIAAWSRSWGRSVSLFSPSTLLDAIAKESARVASMAGERAAVRPIDTNTTALSQHCPCGARVTKRLRERRHRCDACGLVADRDAVAAVLASFVSSSGAVSYDLAARSLPAIRKALSSSGWQDTPSESTDLFARDGSFVAWGTSTPGQTAAARRTVGMAPRPTLNELGPGRTTSGRARSRTDISRAPLARDTS